MLFSLWLSSRACRSAVLAVILLLSSHASIVYGQQGIASDDINPSSEVAAVKQLIKSYEAAVRNGDTGRLGSLFHKNSVTSLNTGIGSRENALDAIIGTGSINGYQSFISDLDIVGRIAVVRLVEQYSSSKAYVSSLHLLNIDGQWKIVSRVSAVGVPSSITSSGADADAVIEVMKDYERGTRKRDIGLLKDAFHPKALMSGYIGRHRLVGSPQPFYDFLRANSVVSDYTGTVSRVSVVGDTASARIVEENLFNMSFINEYLLVKQQNGTWRIASKLFHHGAPKPSPYGAVFRSLSGHKLSKSGVEVYGWAEATWITNDNDSENVIPQAFFNQDEGLNLNQVGLTLCKGDGCTPAYAPDGNNVIGRVTATPGPKGDELRFGYNLTLLYGEDVDFFRTTGIDDDKGFGDQTRSDRTFAIPQVYLDIYFPFAGGTNVILGSFQTSLGNQIGYPFTPPNWFVTRQNSFVWGPAKHVGALAQTKLPIDLSYGIFSVDYGIVRGWNNYEDRNGDPAYMLAARWRSSDMRTWVDFETIFGNGADEFGEEGQGGGSAIFALSTTSEKLNRELSTLTITHKASDKLEFAFEGTYGTQEGGDVAPSEGSPPFLTEDEIWRGVSLASRYALTPRLNLGIRAEWFDSKKGAHGFYAGSPGEINAITTNLDYQFNKHTCLRFEVRYDVYEGDGLPLYGDRDETDQTIVLLNAVVAF